MHRRTIVAVSLTLLLAGLSSCGEAQQPDCCAIAEPVKAPPAAPVVPPPPPADPLNIGSQDARDDLYCGGLILAANPTPDSAMGPIDEAILVKAQNMGVNLAETGIDKLIAGGVAHATHAAMISEAYTRSAGADLAADRPRFTLDACAARAAALPAVQ